MGMMCVSGPVPAGLQVLTRVDDISSWPPTIPIPSLLSEEFSNDFLPILTSELDCIAVVAYDGR